jgi:hypothetical protein
MYGQVLRTYARWVPSLTILALIVFVPIGFAHAITAHAEIGSFDFAGGLRLLAVVGALLTLALTGLLGEVFYTGAVAISLTHPHDGHPPSLREIAGMIAYRRLIAVDLIFGAVVAIGLVLLVAPGIAAFVWLGMAAPVVEIEGHGIRAAFARSVQLVRGSFWVVLAILLPIQVGGEALAELVTELVHGLLGDGLLSRWLADAMTNVAFAPFYAIAVVLLTVDLIHRRDGAGPPLHSEPARA